MKEVDRRTFFKIGLAVATGAVVNEAIYPVKAKLNEEVEKVTNYQAGNASQRTEIEETCKDTSDKLDCYQNFDYSTADKIYAITVGPVTEESVFRGLPSLMLSGVDKREDPFRDVLTGTGGLGLARRELLVGIGTSFLFGLAHNITSKGIDTKTIPASMTFAGGLYWYLQRKLGIASNIATHAMHNFKAVW